MATRKATATEKGYCARYESGYSDEAYFFDSVENLKVWLQEQVEEDPGVESYKELGWTVFEVDMTKPVTINIEREISVHVG